MHTVLCKGIKGLYNSANILVPNTGYLTENEANILCVFKYMSLHGIQGKVIFLKRRKISFTVKLLKVEMYLVCFIINESRSNWCNFCPKFGTFCASQGQMGQGPKTGL